MRAYILSTKYIYKCWFTCYVCGTQRLGEEQCMRIEGDRYKPTNVPQAAFMPEGWGSYHEGYKCSACIQQSRNL